MLTSPPLALALALEPASFSSLNPFANPPSRHGSALPWHLAELKPALPSLSIQRWDDAPARAALRQSASLIARGRFLPPPPTDSATGTSPTMAMYPEAARERDLHRYYQPWLDGHLQSLVNVNTQGAGLPLTYKGYRARPSRDKALTAFAQLAALRLNVRRCMISLVDSHQQYILAEATQTLSLIDDLRHRPGDNIWLGQTVISRRDGVEEHLFGSRYTADDGDGNTFVAEALVIPDLREDDRFKDRDYVKGDPGVLFYAGVPIRTKAGHRIGAYAVSDDNCRSGLSIEELKFMQDMAATVMEHLEMAKDRDDRNKGERMVRGLADFIEGVSEFDTPRNRVNPITVPSCSEDPVDESMLLRSPSFRTHSSTLKRQTENARIEDKESPRASTTRSSFSSTLPTSMSRPPGKDEHEDDVSRVFYRAANIIRTSTGADGVVFFGTVSSDIKGSPNDASGGHPDPSDDSQTSDSGPPSSSGDQRRVRRAKKSPGSVSGVKDPNAPQDGEHTFRPDKTCEVIGLSIDPDSAQEDLLTEKSFSFSERSMERYIKKFPYGKFFSFTDQGAGISSDEKSEPEHIQTMRGITSTPDHAKKTKKKGDKLIPIELLKVLPGIRSLIFLPLWDPMVEKWVAGAFIWVKTAGRLMSPDNELPYLKAFGNSIMSEVTRVNAQRADRAKTTFIASISHELRSPLHGILGSVEFGHETATTPYQASLFTSIEICGKTLLDTIDHVLDYAKINKLGRSRRKKHDARLNKAVGNGSNENSVMGVTTEFDLSALVEEVVEAVCAGDAFKKAHAGAFYSDSVPTVKALTSTSDAFVKDSVDITPHKDGRVTILLNVSPAGGWNVRTQPGALRRIVMNLLGNSLKYTAAGYVTVNLQSCRSPDPSRLDAHLRIVDTGIGMSQEYQRTRLFSPFSQEDPFAVGTGLGLSIVRQIIDSLGGSIDVKSTKGVGTEVDVFLSLALSAQQAKHPESTIMPASMSTKGTKVCLLRPDACIPPSEECIEEHREDNRLISSFRDTCVTWFDMEVTEATSMHEVEADIFFVTEPALINKLFEFHASKSGTAPLVIVCRNPSEEIALKAREEHRLHALGRHVEVVSQPCGPRKLARLISTCLRHIQEEAARPPSNRAISAPPVMAEPRKGPLADTTGKLPYRSGPIRSLSGNEVPSVIEVPEVSLLRDAIKTNADSTENVDRPSITHTPATPAGDDTPTNSVASLPRYNRLHILVVDDNPINLQLLVMFMKKHKYAYVEATNGLEAFERYKDATVIITSPPPMPLGSPSSDSSSPAPSTTSYSESATSISAASFSPQSAPADRKLHTTPLSLDDMPVSTPATFASAIATTPPLNPPLPGSTTVKKSFDFVLMDISMPIMDGFAATREIRRFEQEKGLKPAKIVALTGLASAQAQEEALGSGIDHYLPKPVKFAELRKLVERT
ncbi:histidine kinase G7 [Phyllosticta citricarpa]